jgi:hypothetical protein
LIEGASSKPWLLNVNVPLKPQGVIVTRPALNTYRTRFKIEGEVIEVLRDSMLRKGTGIESMELMYGLS